ALFCSIPLSLTSLTLFRLTPPPPPISTLFPYTTLFRSQFSHPIKKLYSHTHKTVSLLINRNKKALTTELLNNKVLMQLLIKTTHSPLTKKEKLQLKNQLVELGKTIPAFTIFLVPGGSLLLPILIKLLPEILPNSFNENK